MLFYLRQCNFGGVGQARMTAQHELARAQAQAQQRTLTVAREKAANEAKSEFMSLMCHEVRTPLNGCLASAEMLLDTALEVRRFHSSVRITRGLCKRLECAVRV